MVRLILTPTQTVVLADAAQERLWIDDVDGRNLSRTPVDAQAATGAVIGIDHGHEHGVFAQFARMGL